MTQRLFDELVGAPPPSTVDVEGIVRRRRRAHARRRWAGTAVGLTALTAAVAFGGVPGGLDGGIPDGGSAPAGKVRAQPAPPRPPAAGKRSAASLTQAVNTALRQQAPGARWIGATEALPEFTWEEIDGIGANTFRHGVRADGRAGELTVRIIIDAPPQAGAVPAGTHASRALRPDGSVLSVESSNRLGAGLPPAQDEPPLTQRQTDAMAQYLASALWP